MIRGKQMCDEILNSATRKKSVLEVKDLKNYLNEYFQFCLKIIHNYFIIVPSSVRLWKNPSSSMSFRFIWPSMDAYAPVGPVYTTE